MGIFLWLPVSVAGHEYHKQAGYTALIHAAKNGRLDCVRLLVERGANREARSGVRLMPCRCTLYMLFFAFASKCYCSCMRALVCEFIISDMHAWIRIYLCAEIHFIVQIDCY